VRWLAFATALFIALPCAAQESLSFELKCPDTARCGKNELGQWISNWQVRAFAAEQARLKGCIAELEKANRQVLALQRAARSYDEQVESLHAKILRLERQHEARERERAELDHRSTRRLRWAIGSTAVAVVAIGALSAGIYVAGH
jgi:hypothetical protein